jgi:hypothetical protein
MLASFYAVDVLLYFLDVSRDMQARKALGTLTSKDDDETVKPPEKGNTLTEKQKITLINNIQEILILDAVINGDRALNSREEGHTETWKNRH